MTLSLETSRRQLNDTLDRLSMSVGDKLSMGVGDRLSMDVGWIGSTSVSACDYTDDGCQKSY